MHSQLSAIVFVLFFVFLWMCVCMWDFYDKSPTSPLSVISSKPRCMESDVFNIQSEGLQIDIL